MSEPDEKDEHPEMLNDHAPAVARWFYQVIEDMDKKSVFAPPKEDVRYRCPCCRYKTLEERGGYDICPVCFWEDDGQDDEDADTNRVFSPNHMSLMQARENYRQFGACQERLMQHVRPPLPEEL
jgi:hypothetical protein